MGDEDFGLGGTADAAAQPKPVEMSTDEEARAEEAFVDDAEDKVFNPFVEEEEIPQTEEAILTEADMEIPGAVGSGKLETIVPNNPINNEETLGRERNVDMGATKLEDLQSDIDIRPDQQEEGMAAKGESIKVNIRKREAMQPEQGADKTEANRDLSAEMDNLLNGDNNDITADEVEGPTSWVDVVKNTTPKTKPAAKETSATAQPNTPAPTGDLANGAKEDPANLEQTSEAAEVQPKKKKKTGLVLAIVFVILLLCGGVAAILYYNWHESKDKMFSDAMSKLLLVDNADGKLTSTANGLGLHSLKGVTNINYKDVAEYSEDDYYSAKVGSNANFELSINGLNAAAKITTAERYNDDSETSNDVEASYIEGGKVYLRLNKLDASGVLSVVTGIGVTAEEETEDSVAAAETEYDTFKKQYEAVAENAVIGQWVEISDEALKETLGDIYQNDYISCVTNNFEKASAEVKQKMLDAYRENSFLSVSDRVDNLNGAKSGLAYYEAIIDKEKAKAFAKAVENIDVAQDVEKCFEDIAKQDSTEATNDAAGLESVEDEIGSLDETITTELDMDWVDKVHVYLGIKPWTHELSHVVMTGENDTQSLTANFDLGYEAVTVAAPSDAKTIKGIFETIFEEQKKLALGNPEFYVQMICEGDTSESCPTEAQAELTELETASFDEYWAAFQDSLTGKSTAAEEEVVLAE